mgnify:FL=1
MKTYVNVMVIYDQDGNVTPLSIEWEDGRIYEIDQVLDVRKAASTKAGGIGMRYTVKIGRSITYLFFDCFNKWFVEKK